ncbi:adhesion G protein-coupled receptor E3-like isoform X10 [Gopherus evgoodei]|uniref:adhesion G protein-coupled receptor E3-like isoform X10 n=1 Tax=Gopherus evgoodei TaxID=1825980 RepID=UPI0011CFA5E8|nr:adhesion G protein-coupled receptor E3-like isoform X10 [Gopherus evgoodei]
MGTRGDVYPLGLCIALCLWGTGAQNHGVQGTTEDCNIHMLCPANAKCVNNTHCTCLDGYMSHGNRFFTDPTETCDDINECLGWNPPNCSLDANCNNAPGSYYCTCRDGYEPSSGKASFTHTSENSCQDIDECQQNATICEPHGNCINMPGSYMCKCSWGFGKSQKDTAQICTDIDECKKTPDICGPKATCINTYGSYLCECQAGYIPSNRNTTLCQVPSINSSAEFEEIKKTCRNFSLQGKRSSRSSSFCSFFNSTLDILMSMRRDGSAALSLENVTLRFNALLNSTSLWDSGDKWVVGSAVTILLQSVELAALATALRSLERTTQNVMTESLAIQTWLVTGNCSQHSEIFTLRAYEETMDVHCDTVTGAATQAGLGSAAFISYSTLDSIISARHLSKGNLPVGGKLEKSHLNSRVVSGAVGDGRPIHLSRPTKFTLRHRQAKKEEEEAFCVYWKVVAESGSWSPDGCTAVHTNSTHTTCSCDHLSSFAVLMAPIAVTESSPLTIITYVGLTLSLLCLLLAILTFLLCRSIRNVSTSLHLQLCLCLFLANLLFLTAATRIRTQLDVPGGAAPLPHRLEPEGRELHQRQPVQEEIHVPGRLRIRSPGGGYFCSGESWGLQNFHTLLAQPGERFSLELPGPSLCHIPDKYNVLCPDPVDPEKQTLLPQCRCVHPQRPQVTDL